MELSVVIPVYNEQENLQPLYEVLVKVLVDTNRTFEILFIDDGSTDDTFATLTRLASCDRRVRVIKLARNFGQTPATAAGIEHASGRVLITLDGDLQNDPADIPRFLDEIDQGFDIVVGWRFDRKDDFLTRTLPSKVANWLIGRVTGLSLHDNGCSFRAYQTGLIRSIPLYSEMHRFVPTIASLRGARVSEIKIGHHPRHLGESKYGISRFYRVLLDILVINTVFSSSLHNLYIFLRPSVLIFFISIFSIIFIFAQYILGNSEFNTTVFSVSILFLTLSIFLASLGLLAQIVYSTALDSSSPSDGISISPHEGGDPR